MAARLRTIDRKLLRDLLALKGQVAAIAVVIAAGVMTLILSVTSVDAIQLSRDRFYDSHGFADVFADLKRAPDGLGRRIRDIPGVNLVETRVRAPVRLTVPGFGDPVRGVLTSIPDGRQPRLNRLHLRAGRLPEVGRSDRVVVSEPFAEAHGLRPGDRVSAIIKGRYETLEIVGVALSPEFVYQIGPSDLIPDYRRYAVMWMNRSALADAFDMDGAFNNVALTLQAGSRPAPVIDALDRVLARYGGTGAYGREDQVSNRILDQEIEQWRITGVIVPTVFLGVATFLLSVLMGRIVQTQRQQIAVLKAFGYANRDIGRHYALLTGMVVVLGAAAGVAGGAWAAEGMARLYAEYFRFPEMSFRLRPEVALLGIGVAAGAASLGTARAVRRAVGQPPAEAMRPPAPERFRRSALERSRLGRLLDQPTRIVLRNLSRHPLKSALSLLGIGMSTALLLLTAYQFGAVDYLLDVQYRHVLRMDVDVTFNEPTSARAAAELRHLPGVRFVEGYRSVPVRLVHGRADFRTAILGVQSQPRLRRLVDSRLRSLSVPDEGLLLTDYLAHSLGLEPGQAVTVEVLSGHRRTLSLRVAATVDEPVGVSAYMSRDALNRLMREGPAISGAWLLTDGSRDDELYRRLDELPAVAGVGLIAKSGRDLREYIDDSVLVTMTIMGLLAGSIAFAVVYNNARIAFAERERELATLRVLGFTRAEVAWILVGELALLVIAAIPVGWVFGIAFAWILNQAISMDMFRLPFVLTPRVFALSAGVVLSAATLSALIVIRRLRRLDMVGALKTVE